MSVVAWDGKTLAADRQTTCGNFSVGEPKLSQKGGLACATVGDIEHGAALRDWLMAGAKADKFPKAASAEETATLIFVRGGACFHVYSLGVPIKVECERMAWGSGRDLAMGALAMGASAVQAVEVCNEYSPFCGFGVDSFTVGKKGKTR